MSHPPWTASERNALLCGILVAAGVNVHALLLQAIQERHVNPLWYDIVPPNGRTIRACQEHYRDLTNYSQPPHQYIPQGNPTYSLPPGLPPPTSKRSFTEQEPIQTSQRLLQPRPPPFADSPIPTYGNGESSFTVLGTSNGDLSGEKKRKRGRPSKEEQEERDRIYAAQGRVYEPKKRPSKKPRASTETSVATSDPQTPLPQTLEAKEESSSSRRRSRRQKEEEQDTQQVKREPVSPTRGDGSPSDRLLARHGEREREISTSHAARSLTLTNPSDDDASEQRMAEKMEMEHDNEDKHATNHE